jgi:hypothetical protein
VRVQTKTHLFPVATFLVGIVVSFALNRALDQRVDSGPSLVTLVLLAVLVYVAAFTLYLYSSHQEVKRAIGKLNNQFGLVAEFLETGSPEDEHLIFTRVRKLIEDARTSLVFVEMWANSSVPVSETPKTKKLRRGYYNAIVRRVRDHKANSVKGSFMRPFLRRIVLTSDRKLVPMKLEGDTVLSKHLDDCFSIERQSPGLITLGIVSGYETTGFTIVDDRIVIWPVYSFKAETKITREGVIIFTDSTGHFVERLSLVCDELERKGSPLEKPIARNHGGSI